MTSEQAKAIKALGTPRATRIYIEDVRRIMGAQREVGVLKK